MKTKTQPAFIALCYNTRTNLAGLSQYVRIKAEELTKDAFLHNLEISGPIHWNYHGMDGDPNTLFNLEIALPVHDPAEYKGNFILRKIEPLFCIFCEHPGAWEKLGNAYGMLFNEIKNLGLVPNGICREVYHQMDFVNPDHNLTEVQVGLQG